MGDSEARPHPDEWRGDTLDRDKEGLRALVPRDRLRRVKDHHGRPAGDDHPDAAVKIGLPRWWVPRAARGIAPRNFFELVAAPGPIPPPIDSTSNPRIIPMAGPGPTLGGGFNLDTGYFERAGNVYHFGVVTDSGESFLNVVNNESIYGCNLDPEDPLVPECGPEWQPPDSIGDFPEKECRVSGGDPVRPGCPENVFGNLVVMDAMGENLVCKYTTPAGQNEELFTPVYVDGNARARHPPTSPFRLTNLGEQT